MTEGATVTAKAYSYLDTTKKTTYYDCEICLGLFDSQRDHCYGTKICHHCVCQACMRDYLYQVLKDNHYKDYTNIFCPGENCNQAFDTDKLVKEVFFDDEQAAEGWWHHALRSKAYIKNKVRCPRDDCGALFDVDETLTYQCTFTECALCHIGFCITCETPWHPGIIKVVDNKEALRKTLNTAKESYWCRCPNCRQVVEREDGCAHIYCVCGAEFCYHCGRDSMVCNDDCEFWSMKQLDEHRKGMFDYREEDT